MSGFGPETITILEAEGVYQYAVEKFEPACGNPPGTEFCPTQLEASGAVVRVYDVTGLIATFTVPTSGNTGMRYWYVFDLNGPTGEITTTNCFTNAPSPIDSPPTCP